MYADVADIDRLQESAGLPTGLFNYALAICGKRAGDLIDMVGIAQSDDGNKFVHGLTKDPFLPTTGTQDRILRGFSVTGVASAVQGVVGDDVDSATIGSWLIRDTPAAVPLPTPVILLGSGFVVLIRWRHRSSKGRIT